MTPRRGRAWAPAVILGLLAAGLGGCGDEDADDIMLMGTAQWRDDPGSVENLGYHVWADVGWIDRAGTCARIPRGLRATVNGIEGTQIGTGGDCPFDTLFDAGPFTSPDPITVRLFDGERLLGEATFEGAFWGMQAALVAPAGGQASAGDEVVVSIPPGRASPPEAYASWYWLDTAPSVPPFYTTSGAVLDPASATIRAHVPDVPGLSGDVALTFSYPGEEYATNTACTGFSNCLMTAHYTLGPVPLTVLAR